MTESEQHLVYATQALMQALQIAHPALIQANESDQLFEIASLMQIASHYMQLAHGQNVLLH